MKRILTFEWESEKHIRISEAGAENSLFYEIYRQALAGVVEIIRASTICCSGTDPIFYKNKLDYTQKVDHNFVHSNIPNYYNYPSNMLVFSGERGAGKSSALLTFASSLVDKNSQLFSAKFIKEVAMCELANVNDQLVKSALDHSTFCVLPPIDPTTLESDGEILLTILARLFQMANDAWDSRSNNIARVGQDKMQQKNELMKQFSICYNHLITIKGKKSLNSEFTGLDSLAELGDSTQFKREITLLVEYVLRFCCNEGNHDPYLVLQIDDTDMNIEHAYTILEDIRKYLVIPRVIILMAADLNHLKTVIENNFLPLYSDKRDDLRKEVAAITQQYMIKMFPQTRQLHLPALGTYFKEHTDNLVIEYHTPEFQILPDNTYPSDNIQDGIIRLIYRKTGIVFFRQEDTLHSIIPENMRQMAHFLSMLIQMEDIEDPDQDVPSFFLNPKNFSYSTQQSNLTPETIEHYQRHANKIRSRLRNVERFRDYFLYTWVGQHLNAINKEKIFTLEKIDLTRKCSYALSLLRVNRSHLESAFCKDIVAACKIYDHEHLIDGGEQFTFAIHVYFTLLSHIIVLQTLVEFYDREKVEDYGSDYLQPFSKLYYLFGTSPFYYGNEDSLFKQNTVYECTNEMVLRWNHSLIIPPANPYLSGLATYLYSELIDYKSANYVSNFEFDLCNPIVNCLYMGHFSTCSPFVRRVFTETSSVKIDAEKWRKLRSSALITMLNWEIYCTINKNITECIYKTDQSDMISMDDWLNHLHSFYAKILPSHIDQSTYPIAAIQNINYSEWAFCLNPDEINKVVLNEEEKEFLNSLLNLLWINFKDSTQQPPTEENTQTEELAISGQDTSSNELADVGGTPTQKEEN